MCELKINVHLWGTVLCACLGDVKFRIYQNLTHQQELELVNIGNITEKTWEIGKTTSHSFSKWIGHSMTKQKKISSVNKSYINQAFMHDMKCPSSIINCHLGQDKNKTHSSYRVVILCSSTLPSLQMLIFRIVLNLL